MEPWRTGRAAVFPSRTSCGSTAQDNAWRRSDERPLQRAVGHGRHVARRNRAYRPADELVCRGCHRRPARRLQSGLVEWDRSSQLAHADDVARREPHVVLVCARDFRSDVGRESPVLVGVNQGVVWLTDVSSDGKWLLYHGLASGTAGDIWALPLSGEPTPVPWLQSPAHEVFARFSPDGRWVAFVQREAEGFAVYVDAFPARGHRQRVSPGTGQSPMWSSDGRRLYYLPAPGFRMMEVQLAPTPEDLRVSPPAELFRAPTPNSTIERVRYWPAPDGQRFLFIARQDEALPRTINVVLDWPALVSRRADTRHWKILPECQIVDLLMVPALADESARMKSSLSWVGWYGSRHEARHWKIRRLPECQIAD